MNGLFAFDRRTRRPRNETTMKSEIPTSICDILVRAAEINPSGKAFVTGDHWRSWSQLADDIARKAVGLEELGLSPGSRVAVLAGVSEEHVELTFLLGWLGATIVPLNTRLSSAEHLEILRSADLTTLIYDLQFADRAEDVANTLGLKLLPIADILNRKPLYSGAARSVSLAGRRASSFVVYRRHHRASQGRTHSG